MAEYVKVLRDSISTELPLGFGEIAYAPKQITLTEGYLMMPSKSVTAVIGVSRAPAACVIEGCEACGKKDCAFRR